MTAGVALGCAYVAGLYQLERLARGGALLAQVATSAAASGVALAVAVYLTAGWYDNLGPLGRVALSETLVTFALWQLASRTALARAFAGRLLQLRWLLVTSGAGPSAPAVARLRAAPMFAQLTEHVSGAAQAGALGAALGRAWSGVVLANDAALAPEEELALMRARLGGARIEDLTAVVERLEGRVPLARLQPRWFITSDGFELAHSRTTLRIKRMMDVLVSLFMLVAASWLMVLAGLAVAASGRGGIIFRQRRVGRRGRVFVMYKFRTMRPDAEAGGARWAAAGDPRATLVGRVMRATRIDELPQLWNILRGDMSFIGPRPERPEFTGELEASIPFYAMRHLVKPGLTGWAQVCFPYGASRADALSKLEYDLYYIKNHSLMLDLAILLRTVRVVVHQQGAR